jgi:hypothetical protein
VPGAAPPGLLSGSGLGAATARGLYRWALATCQRCEPRAEAQPEGISWAYRGQEAVDTELQPQCLARRLLCACTGLWCRCCSASSSGALAHRVAAVVLQTTHTHAIVPLDAVAVLAGGVCGAGTGLLAGQRGFARQQQQQQQQRQAEMPHGQATLVVREAVCLAARSAESVVSRHVELVGRARLGRRAGVPVLAHGRRVLDRGVLRAQDRARHPAWAPRCSRGAESQRASRRALELAAAPCAQAVARRRPARWTRPSAAAWALRHRLRSFARRSCAARTCQPARPLAGPLAGRRQLISPWDWTPARGLDAGGQLGSAGVSRGRGPGQTEAGRERLVAHPPTMVWSRCARATRGWPMWWVHAAWPARGLAGRSARQPGASRAQGSSRQGCSRAGPWPSRLVVLGWPGRGRVLPVQPVAPRTLLDTLLDTLLGTLQAGWQAGRGVAARQGG